MNNETIYEAIALLAKYLCEENREITFSQLAERLSVFFGEDVSGGRGAANRVRGAYNHFEGDCDAQENITKAFVNEQGGYAYE